VCDVEPGLLTIVYKVFGDGTRQMSEMSAGESLNLLSGLGNGFSLDNSATAPLLVGGGVGIPPLYNLAKRLLLKGVKPTILLGFNTASQAFMVDDFTALGVDVVVTTADGSLGIKGLITAALPDIDFDYTYSCGPIPMLKALSDATTCLGEFSFEERMGCGFGACVGCTCKTKYGNKRICKEGPVLKKEEIIW
ncbi:MAG: dihydroorotate dehydrogenase electron transfer subunit, partial [Rikenellaceae bacterium]